MYPYPVAPRRAHPGSHPSLGAFLGLVFLALVVPYALNYGLMALAGALVFAGILAGALARGGARTGAGSGARAAGFFMLILLLSHAIILLSDGGFINLAGSPEMARFVPFIVLVQGLWAQIQFLMQPVLGQLIALTGGDVFVELLLLVSLPAVGAALGGALGGAVAGRATPKPVPTNMAPYPAYPPHLFPEYPPAMPPEQPFVRPGDPGMPPDVAGMPEGEMDYLCPWCGLRVLPDMERCWSCEGPLDAAPPPPPAF